MKVNVDKALDIGYMKSVVNEFHCKNRLFSCDSYIIMNNETFESLKLTGDIKWKGVCGAPVFEDVVIALCDKLSYGVIDIVNDNLNRRVDNE